MEARSSITVNAERDDVYRRWRDFGQLPTFMYHLESVTASDDRHSHWVAKGPADTTLEWDAEITEDEPGSRLAWRSLPGATVENAGEVRFVPAPGDRGTEVHVKLDYSPPGGAIGSLIAKLFGEEPSQQISDDLRRFKQLIETGEIARSGGSPEGARTANAVSHEAARPTDGEEVTTSRSHTSEVRS